MRKFAIPTVLPVGLFLALSASLTGCTAGEPDAPLTNAQAADIKPAPPPDMAKPDDGRIDPPILDAIENVTAYDTVPVHGTTEQGASVLIKAKDGSTPVPASVASSGRFCVDVPLKKNTLNQFDVIAIDANGNASDPVPLQVQQNGSPPVATSAPLPAQNMAIGGVAASSMTWDHGDNASVRDANTATYGGFWQRTFRTTDWVVLRLSDRRKIDSIRFKAPSDCMLTTPFKIYVSNADAPSDPNTQPMAWTLAKDVTANMGGTNYGIKFNTPPILSHVAIYFDRGSTGFAGGALPPGALNCGNSWTWGAYYEISEIEAWSVANAVPPPPPAAGPSCNGGG